MLEKVTAITCWSSVSWRFLNKLTQSRNTAFPHSEVWKEAVDKRRQEKEKTQSLETEKGPDCLLLKQGATEFIHMTKDRSVNSRTSVAKIYPSFNTLICSVYGLKRKTVRRVKSKHETTRVWDCCHVSVMSAHGQTGREKSCSYDVRNQEKQSEN